MLKNIGSDNDENITLMNLFKRKTLLYLLKVFTLPVVIVIVLFTIAYKGDFSFAIFSRDPIQILNGKPFYGVLSNIGAIVWSGTAAILFYSYFVSKRNGVAARRSLLLLISGVLTTCLLIDDLFLMHDVVFPEYLHINEKVLYSFYGLMVIAIFYFFFSIVKKTDYLFLILSFGFLGCSVFTDVLVDLGIHIPYYFTVEDGFKFLGIISWSVYFIRTSFRTVQMGSETL